MVIILIDRRVFENGEYTHSIDIDWDSLRRMRNKELQDSDWRALKDVVLSTAWRDYRSALRDLPQDHAESNDAADAWPVVPDA